MPKPLSIPIIERIVAFCCRWPGAVTLAGLLLALAASLYTATHFAMNTNSGDLISPDTAGASARPNSTACSRSNPT